MKFPIEISINFFSEDNVHTTPEKFENATTITANFEFVFEENSGREIPSSQVLCPHENTKPAFSISSGLISVFEKLRFRDGLVWTEGLTGEIKLRFQSLPGVVPKYRIHYS